jgi:hypothetical protein
MTDMDLSEWAASCAEGLLAPLGSRWAHSQGVAQQARRAGAIVDQRDRAGLIAAAYLHDVGYAPDLAVTGFHPLDGARHLRDLGQERLAGLVAYHSGAREEAALRGLSAELAAFEDEASDVSLALTYADMTTGPTGEVVTLTERISDIDRRYGAESVVTRSIRQAQPELERLIAKVQVRLSMLHGYPATGSEREHQVKT